eukprot:1677741-Ditylum_brightwellii.AAC.1
MVDNYLTLFNDKAEEEEEEEEYNSVFFVSDIKDAKYEQVSKREVAAAQKHLSSFQHNCLEAVLHDTPMLFDSKLGWYPHKKVHLEVDPRYKPMHSRAYSVPKAYEAAFKRELQHLAEIGVLKPCGPTQWATETFIIPKKD